MTVAIDFETADRGVLNACCRAAGVRPPRRPFACTVEMARRTWHLRRNRLPDVCRHLGAALDRHDPLFDAGACTPVAIAARRAGAMM